MLLLRSCVFLRSRRFSLLRTHRFRRGFIVSKSNSSPFSLVPCDYRFPVRKNSVWQVFRERHPSASKRGRRSAVINFFSPRRTLHAIIEDSRGTLSPAFTSRYRALSRRAGSCQSVRPCRFFRCRWAEIRCQPTDLLSLRSRTRRCTRAYSTLCESYRDDVKQKLMEPKAPLIQRPPQIFELPRSRRLPSADLHAPHFRVAPLQFCYPWQRRRTPIRLYFAYFHSESDDSYIEFLGFTNRHRERSNNALIRII